MPTMNGKTTEESNNDKSESNLGNSKSSNQQDWVVVEYSNSDNKNTVAEKSPLQTSKNEPETSSFNLPSSNYQQDLQHLGAWSQTKESYPTSIESSIAEDSNHYSIERYQEQESKEDPWSTVTFYNK